MLCKSCKGFATKTTDNHPGVKFLLYGCRILKTKFGDHLDFAKKAPKKCGSYEAKNLQSL